MQTIFIIVIVSSALFGFFRWFERANVWLPRSTFVGQPEAMGLAYEDVYFNTEDGVRLHGWYFPAKQPIASLLFMHGNGGNLSYRTESLRQFHSLSLNIFIFDYRGYGKSRGWLSEAGTYRDALAAYQWLKQQTPELPLILFGRSLGAAIAVDLAARTDAHALVAESCFTSIPDVGAEMFPFLPVRWFSTIQYNALSKIPNIAMPLMVVHSPEDTLVPFSHGRKLFEAAPQPKIFVELSGGHNSGYLQSEPVYLAKWQHFLENYVLTQTAAAVENPSKP